jgi:superfamily II DNA or RNA helicase/HKD family nuclease
MNNIKLVTDSLLDELVQYMEQSDTIYLLVSFVMESGVHLLAQYLRAAAARGADIKILSGDYLYITQPIGLQKLLIIDPRIEIRLWKSNGTAFHAKAYLLSGHEGPSAVVVGSSNLSASALTHGVEWSLLASSVDGPGDVLDTAEHAFIKMFYDENTISLNDESLKLYTMEHEEYHRCHPDLAHQWIERESMTRRSRALDANSGLADAKQPYDVEIQPRVAQIEALEQLQITREEGYDRALVVMATGLGKTYLAALFARDFNRVLFIAHREEILFQARTAFSSVMPGKSCGVYYGQEKQPNADLVFASIYTLSMQNHRRRFTPEDFDLIVVDEFHHAAAKSYQVVMDYFRPKFLSAITATPDRADGRDVYALCDGNVAYKVDFIEAIQREWLAPFRYYGVYDETDYSKIRWLGSRYDEDELRTAQLRESIARSVFKAWVAHQQSRTLAFCSSIAQAEFLCEYFVRMGVRAVSLTSKSAPHHRSGSIGHLERGELDAIFTVDLFNEGVDIPSVDTLLFVRPTESLTVFTQQIGRGLRLHSGKSGCVIVDFIGNYRNADVKLSLFQVEGALRESTNSKVFVIPIVPETCAIELDTRVVDLLEEMNRKRHPRRDALRSSYLTVYQDLGRRPTYAEVHLHGTADSRGYKQEFGSWPAFLLWAGQLTDDEAATAERYAGWFKELESTAMTKSYKMVLLLAMLERGLTEWDAPITPQEVAPFFHRYLTEKEYRQRTDLNDNASRKLREFDTRAVTRMVANAPMKNWGATSRGHVVFESNEFRVLLDIHADDRVTLFEWTREICLYRLHTYFERKGQSGTTTGTRSTNRSNVFKV